MLEYSERSLLSQKIYYNNIHMFHKDIYLTIPSMFLSAMYLTIPSVFVPTMYLTIPSVFFSNNATPGWPAPGKSWKNLENPGICNRYLENLENREEKQKTWKNLEI